MSRTSSATRSRTPARTETLAPRMSPRRRAEPAEPAWTEADVESDRWSAAGLTESQPDAPTCSRSAAGTVAGASIRDPPASRRGARRRSDRERCLRLGGVEHDGCRSSRGRRPVQLGRGRRPSVRRPRCDRAASAAPVDQRMHPLIDVERKRRRRVGPVRLNRPRAAGEPRRRLRLGRPESRRKWLTSGSARRPSPAAGSPTSRRLSRWPPITCVGIDVTLDTGRVARRRSSMPSARPAVVDHSCESARATVGEVDVDQARSPSLRSAAADSWRSRFREQPVRRRPARVEAARRRGEARRRRRSADARRASRDDLGGGGQPKRLHPAGQIDHGRRGRRRAACATATA